MRNALTAVAGLACIAVFCVRGERAVTHTAPTFDEAVHLTAGYSYWRTGDFRINRETPPLMKLLWALPLLATDRPPFQPDPEQLEQNDIWRLGDAFLYESPLDFRAMLYPARRVNLAVGAALVALIGWWAWRLWSRAAGVTGSALAALDPNLLGQSAVLSTDVGLTLFGTAAVYALWEYAAAPRRSWFLAAGICFGLALATKYSATVIVFACGLSTVGFVLAGGSFALPATPIPSTRRARLGQLLPAAVRLGLIAVAVILPIYFVWHALDWPRGFRQQLGRNEAEPPKYFLNGEISTQGWWWYFPETLMLKTPAGTLILALLAGLKWRSFSRRDVAYVLGPPMAFVLVMMATRLNIGLRVILPAYPLLWLLAARVASLGAGPYSRGLACLAVVVGIALPTLLDTDRNGQSLSYFNGIVTGRAEGHHYLGDSNIDWGQGLHALSAKLQELGNPVIYFSYAGTARPEAYGIRYEQLPGWGTFRPAPGERVDLTGRIVLAVSVSNLQGTYLQDPTTYHWLRERTPISRTDDSIWLFDITGDPESVERVKRLTQKSP